MHSIEKINIKLADIYSFGVIIYEIITEISPEAILEKHHLSRNDKIAILRKNYCQFLFENLDNCIDNYKDFYGNTTKGMKMIVEKCMEINPENRFQSMDEIIDLLKKLPIYEKNREEIEYRFNSAPDSRNYCCSISDVIIGYYLCYKNDNLRLIKNILNQKDSNLDLKQNDVIYQILDTFKICYHLIVEDSKLNYIVSLLNTAKNEDVSSSGKVLREIQNIFDFYNQYQFLIPSKETFYINFFKILKDNQENFGIDLDDESKIDENFKSIISKIINNEITGNSRHYYLDYFVSNIFDKFLNSQIIKEKLRKEIIFDDYEYQFENDRISYADIDDSLIYSEPSYAARVCLDSELSYVLFIRYNEALNHCIIEREKKIYQSDISKFVVHSVNAIKKRNNFIIIPYFSLGTINNILDKNSFNFSNIELTNLDKFTILIEVATGLNDLNSKNEFHGNLWSQSIFLSASKDAYIGYFSYDRMTEINSSKTVGPVYYRAPEVAEKFDYVPKPEEYQDYVKMQQLGDVFSFGVVMHEIITDMSPIKRFGNMTRSTRMKIIQGNEYFSFLTSGDNNDFFNDGGQETLKIIEKCMSPDLNRRYRSMNEVINALKQDPHYKLYEKEIDYRLKMAKPSQEVKCNLSDVFCSFYRGKETASKKIVEKTLCIYHQSYSFEIPSDEEIIKACFDSLYMKDKESDSFNDHC